MKRVFVAGLGAVSPAGWTAAALKAALRANQPLPDQTLSRPGWESPAHPLRARLVPNPSVRPGFLAHPRLRRSSPVTHYAAAAALEAMAPLQAKWPAAGRLGIIACLQTGCVQYSCRFYDETLKDPATASPLVFPETVYAAPTSHVAALLPNVVIAYSLVGDASAFLQGVALAAGWLGENRVDACLVLGAEETNWIIADAFRLLDRTAIIAAGAGALCLCTDAALSLGVELAAITDVHTPLPTQNPAQAAQAMRCQLGAAAAGELLVDSRRNGPRADAAEQAAWSDWTGPRISPKAILGEGLMAAAAWQCVTACDAVATGDCAAANVSQAGAQQPAIGGRFVRG